MIGILKIINLLNSAIELLGNYLINHHWYFSLLIKRGLFYGIRIVFQHETAYLWMFLTIFWHGFIFGVVILDVFFALLVVFWEFTAIFRLSFSLKSVWNNPPSDINGINFTAYLSNEKNRFFTFCDIFFRLLFYQLFEYFWVSLIFHYSLRAQDWSCSRISFYRLFCCSSEWTLCSASLLDSEF